MQTKKLSPEERIYARALLLSVAGVGVGIMAEESSLRGGTQARKASPAWSIPRVGTYEGSLYDLIDAAKTHAVERSIQPQTITITAHPNFSRSHRLVELSHDLSRELGKLDRQAQAEIERTGALPGTNAGKTITEILASIKRELKPRTGRNRYEELKETTLDFIPTLMQAADEQIDLFKTRKAILRGGQGEAKATFTSLAQLDAVAATLPKYNSWFADGDGKRTCHVYDMEVAVPAVKRATYAHYQAALDGFKKLPNGKLGAVDVDRWKRELGNEITLLHDVEERAVKRMQALNEFLAASEEYRKADPQNVPAQRKVDAARIKAQAASSAYMEKLNEKIDGQPVYDILRQDKISRLRQEIGGALSEAYSGKTTLDPLHKELAEDLYTKLSAYGNFAVRMQRRENAKEYREVFEYLMKNCDSLRKEVAQRSGLSEAEVQATQLDSKTSRQSSRFSRAVRALAEAAMDDASSVRQLIYDHYRSLAGDLEKVRKPGDNGNTGDEIKPLEYRELLTLDALGYFNMSRLYPEAFQGGFVIAEYAQPNTTFLQEHADPQHKQDVANEVKTRAKTDMELQVALARSMWELSPSDKQAGRKAVSLPLIPLHEDPVALEHIPAAQAALREGPLAQYLLEYMGIRGSEEEKAALAAQKAVQYVTESGDSTANRGREANHTENWDKVMKAQAKPLTAYQDLRRYGFSDAEMERASLDIALLKKTHILEGPPDMEACSDNSKRATIIGAELAEHSVREKALTQAKLAASKNESERMPLVFGGQNYMLRKPKYYGQGGAVSRATDTPLDTVQATFQGEHPMMFVPRSLAQKAYHSLLGRLYLTGEAASGRAPAAELQAIASSVNGTGLAANMGNRLGFPGSAMSDDERALMEHTIASRIASTRDDERYNRWMEKYGGPALNYSARAGSRGQGFNDERAIGVAAKEGLAGIFSNIIGLSALFDFGHIGGGGGVMTEASKIEMQRWKNKDYSIQHRLSAAALIGNFVSLDHAWQQGNITYTPSDGVKEPVLTKKGVSVPLSTLTKAYKTQLAALDEQDKPTLRHQQEYDAGNGVKFDSADLVMAHLSEQFLRLEKGLHAIYADELAPKGGKRQLIDLFNPSHHADILATKQLFNDVLDQLNATKASSKALKAKPKEELTADEQEALQRRELLEGAYYLIFERGDGIFPMSVLMEQTLLAQKPGAQKAA